MKLRLPLLCLLLISPGISTAQDDAPPNPKAAKAAYDKADKELNAAYAAAKKTLEEAEFKELQDSQRAWLHYRDYLARSPLYTGSGGSDELPLTSPWYLDAAADLTEMRARWLKGLAATEPGYPESLTGVWTDSYGGRLEIVHQDGKLHFHLQVVRGPTSHLGGIAGIATWNQNIGWFSDKTNESAVGKVKDEGETNLAFVFRDRQLEILGANTGYYHGARAYFDGKFVRVEELAAKEKQRVLKAAETGEVSEE